MCNQQMAFWQKYSDEKLTKMGLKPEYIALIHEALAFHKLEPGELPKERLNHEEAVQKEDKPK